MNWLLCALYLLFTNLGVVFMKLGGDSLKISFTSGFNFKIGFYTFVGFIFYLCSFVLWQKLLVSNNLSYVIPILTGAAQVISCILAFSFFKETITIYNIVGIVLIVGGIFLLTLKGAH